MKAVLKWWVLLLLCCCRVGATTYYIDWAAGNDANNGTSTSTPWRRCPGMINFNNGSYVHVAGDQYLFKGGITWPVAAFNLIITDSGTSGSNDVYGTDVAYYSGASWTRPIFDMAYTNVTLLGANVGSAIYVTGDYITFRGIEIKRLRVENSTNWNSFGVCSIQGSATAASITIQNCFIHSWKSFCPTSSLPASISNTDSDFGGLYFALGPVTLLQSTIGWGAPPTGLAGNSGCAAAGGFSVIRSNTFVGCSQFVNASPSEISYNTFRNGTNSYDPEYHANAVYSVMSANNQVSRIHGNVFHSLDTTFQTILCHIGGGGVTNTSLYVYNNVFWNLTAPINLDESGIVIANSNTRGYVWNNTVAHNPAVGVVLRSQAFHLTVVDCRNNHWISDTNAGGNTNPIATANSAPGAYENPGTLIDQNNLWHTAAQAASAGYNIGNSWKWTSVSSPTVDYGQNLTSSNILTADILGIARPASGAWDSGAYEYVAPLAPAMTIGPGMTLGSGVTIR